MLHSGSSTISLPFAFYMRDQVHQWSACLLWAGPMARGSAGGAAQDSSDDDSQDGAGESDDDDLLAAAVAAMEVLHASNPHFESCQLEMHESCDSAPLHGGDIFIARMNCEFYNMVGVSFIRTLKASALTRCLI